MSDYKQCSDAAQTGPGVGPLGGGTKENTAPSPSGSTAPASSGGVSESEKRGSGN